MGLDEAKREASQALIPQVVGGSNEIAPTAGAAQVAALVQSRFVMALKQPRNLDQVRQDLKMECSRPSFALEEREGDGNSALYRRPVGGGKVAEGLGIRFAEVAERCMGNIMTGALTIAEDEKKKTKYCFVLDLQTNNSWEDTIDISKTVERRQPKQGDEVISQRVNSTGQTVFTIAASEDALATKEAAAISKKLRTLILRLIPGDLQDECISIIKEMRAKRITEDPEGAKKRVIDGMFQQNVTVTMLEEYLGHPVGQCSPAEILNLQGIYGALRDGITTWKDLMDNLEAARAIKPREEPSTTTTADDKGMAAAKAEEAKKQTAAQTPPPTQTAPAQTAPVVTEAQKPAESVAEKPPETQQTTAAPVQQPAVPPTPPAADTPPAWATTEAPKVETAAQAAPVAQAVQFVWSTQDGIMKLSGEAPGGLGKAIKNIQFPARMTKEGPAESCTPEQFQRAENALTELNGRLGKAFKLDSTVKNWFQCDLATINSYALECVIKVVETWV